MADNTAAAIKIERIGEELSVSFGNRHLHLNGSSHLLIDALDSADGHFQVALEARDATDGNSRVGIEALESTEGPYEVSKENIIFEFFTQPDPVSGGTYLLVCAITEGENQPLCVHDTAFASFIKEGDGAYTPIGY